MKMNRYSVLRVAVVVAAAAMMAGCSLLKVSVSTGDPLPKEDVQVRMVTRGFYYDFSTEIARAADSIAAASVDLGTRVASVRWKLRATRAGVTAAMQGIPDVAMADLWILCRRMNNAFAATPDSLLFGPMSDVARATASRLDRRMDRLARETLSSSRYGLMSRFVEEYVRAHPAAEAEAANTTLAWVEYLRAHGVKHAYTTGSIAEVLADVNDRLSGQTQQLSNSLGWSKDLFEMEFRQDSLRSQITSQIDSLSRSFERIVTVAEQVPAISDKALEEFNNQVARLLSTFNTTVSLAFTDLDRQRGELQTYVSGEREALVDQLRASVDEVVAQVMAAVPGLIGKVLLYLVLALVVLLGLPFAVGFWLGSLRQKSRQARK